MFERWGRMAGEQAGQCSPGSAARAARSGGRFWSLAQISAGGESSLRLAHEASLSPLIRHEHRW